ncbi:helix-turn-helix transcriptional regulator [Rhodanobacter sp. Col0626]|uniref:helix-turn-helix transcriptional regulator n=1 Tax=Rhodanobacter sp. Col0626 TaxID=3415679 RepID=UPI003CE83DC4
MPPSLTLGRRNPDTSGTTARIQGNHAWPIESTTDDVRLQRFLAQNLTQAGLTRQTIAAIELGLYSPSLEIAFRIAKISIETKPPVDP